VLEGTPGSKSELLTDLFTQLGLDTSKLPERESELGRFMWSFYTFDRGEAIVDIALTEQEGKAYFVLLLSPMDEHEQLHDGLFLPAVESITPIN
jgi:hypothetical protein